MEKEENTIIQLLEGIKSGQDQVKSEIVLLREETTKLKTEITELKNEKEEMKSSLETQNFKLEQIDKNISKECETDKNSLYQIIGELTGKIQKLQSDQKLQFSNFLEKNLQELETIKSKLSTTKSEEEKKEETNKLIVRSIETTIEKSKTVNNLKGVQERRQLKIRLNEIHDKLGLEPEETLISKIEKKIEELNILKKDKNEDDLKLKEDDYYKISCIDFGSHVQDYTHLAYAPSGEFIVTKRLQGAKIYSENQKIMSEFQIKNSILFILFFFSKAIFLM